MDIELDINTILELYKNRVSELEHQLILQIAKNTKLEELINKDKK